MAENFSIEHSRTKITEVKKTIEDKKQKLDEFCLLYTSDAADD